MATNHQHCLAFGWAGELLRPEHVQRIETALAEYREKELLLAALTARYEAQLTDTPVYNAFLQNKERVAVFIAGKFAEYSLLDRSSVSSRGSLKVTLDRHIGSPTEILVYHTQLRRLLQETLRLHMGFNPYDPRVTVQLIESSSRVVATYTPCHVPALAPTWATKAFDEQLLAEQAASQAEGAKIAATNNALAAKITTEQRQLLESQFAADARIIGERLRSDMDARYLDSTQAFASAALDKLTDDAASIVADGDYYTQVLLSAIKWAHGIKADDPFYNLETTILEGDRRICTRTYINGNLSTRLDDDIVKLKEKLH